MLSLRDCLDFCELSDDAIGVIIEHEHVPAIVAAEIGRTLMDSPDGVATLQSFMRDCIDHARAKGRSERVRELQRIHAEFVKQQAANR